MVQAARLVNDDDAEFGGVGLGLSRSRLLREGGDGDDERDEAEK